MILSLGRDLSLEANWQIIDAAIKWRSRGSLNGANGVVGIDMTGPESRSLELSNPWMSEATGPEGILREVEQIRPNRIGHGIELLNAQGIQKQTLHQLLNEQQICLEICPTVNLVTRVIPDYGCIANFVRDLAHSEIPYCINTDNPYLIHTKLKNEHEIIAKELGADADSLVQLGIQHAAHHRFITL